MWGKISVVMQLTFTIKQTVIEKINLERLRKCEPCR